jgi:hypothetical protein
VIIKSDKSPWSPADLVTGPEGIEARLPPVIETLWSDAQLAEWGLSRVVPTGPTAEETAQAALNANMNRTVTMYQLITALETITATRDDVKGKTYMEAIEAAQAGGSLPRIIWRALERMDPVRRGSGPVEALRLAFALTHEQVDYIFDEAAKVAL